MPADEHRSRAQPQEPAEQPLEPADLRIARLAQRQWSVVDREDLRRLGLQRGAIEVRLRQRRLVLQHRGVYRHGVTPLRLEGHVLAAVKACGAGALACADSAGLLQGLVERAPWDPVHVLVPVLGRRSRRRIRVHTTAAIHPDDATVVRGVPCTSWARTVLDLGELHGRRAVEKALDQAAIHRLYDAGQLLDCVRRAPGRRGAAVVLEVHGTHLAGSTVTESDLEELLVAVCRDWDLPMPRFQVPIDEWRADALWPDERVVAELDGGRFHATATARRRDRRKDTGLRRRGLLVLRFDDHDLTTGAAETVAEIRQALRDRGS